MSILLVISAPSGAGKSTLVNAILDSEERIEYAISVTTRPPRAQEVSGRDYWFVNEARFQQMREGGELLEWANVFGYSYGTPVSAFERARDRGNDLVLDIDVQGASSLVEKLPNTVSIFILPPSVTKLEQRLRKRASDEDAVIERRLGEASREIREYKSYDYVVINNDLADSVAELKAILVAERRKRRQMEGAIAPILEDFGIRPDAVPEANE